MSAKSLTFLYIKYNVIPDKLLPEHFKPSTSPSGLQNCLPFMNFSQQLALLRMTTHPTEVPCQQDIHDNENVSWSAEVFQVLPLSGYHRLISCNPSLCPPRSLRALPAEDHFQEVLLSSPSPRILQWSYFQFSIHYMAIMKIKKK